MKLCLCPYNKNSLSFMSSFSLSSLFFCSPSTLSSRYCLNVTSSLSWLFLGWRVEQIFQHVDLNYTKFKNVRMLHSLVQWSCDISKFKLKLHLRDSTSRAKVRGGSSPLQGIMRGSSPLEDIILRMPVKLEGISLVADHENLTIFSI